MKNPATGLRTALPVADSSLDGLGWMDLSSGMAGAMKQGWMGVWSSGVMESMGTPSDGLDDVTN